MSEFSWGLMGYNPERPNNIGLELKAQIERSHGRLGLENAPSFILRSGGLMGPDGKEPHPATKLDMVGPYPDVVFVALPSTEDGEPAATLITDSLRRAATVITCEKGALASNFARLRELSDNFERLGFNATFGGGTKVMEKSKADHRDPDNIKAIHMKPNATKEFMRKATSMGVPKHKAREMAIHRGMAEPDGGDIHSFVRNEIVDIAMKTAIFANQSGLIEPEDFITWHGLGLEITDEQIDYALANPKTNHFIASMYPLNRETDPTPKKMGGFDIARGNWRIMGGYLNPAGIPALERMSDLAMGDICVVTSLGTPDSPDGNYPISGPGAGPAPTVNAMLDDYIRLVRDKTEV